MTLERYFLSGVTGTSNYFSLAVVPNKNKHNSNKKIGALLVVLAGLVFAGFIGYRRCGWRRL